MSADLLESGPAVCARGYFLDYAVSRAAWDGKMPGDVLDLTVGVLGARGQDTRPSFIVASLRSPSPIPGCTCLPRRALAGCRVAARNVRANLHSHSE